MKFNDLIRQMEESGFKLSGSRFFNEKSCYGLYLKAGTDWDFSCPHTPEMLAFLDQNGFTRKLIEEQYMDNNTIAVYDHADYPIEVCIKESMLIHDMVFEEMDIDFYRRFIWKSSRRLVYGMDRNDIRELVNQLIRVAKLKIVSDK